VASPERRRSHERKETVNEDKTTYTGMIALGMVLCAVILAGLSFIPINITWGHKVIRVNEVFGFLALVPMVAGTIAGFRARQTRFGKAALWVGLGMLCAVIGSMAIYTSVHPDRNANQASQVIGAEAAPQPER
jgi:hypothetical protein